MILTRRFLPGHLAVALLLGGASAAQAATQFIQVSTSDTHRNDSKMKMLIDGTRYRGEFLENASSMPPAGSYFLGLGDDGMYIVVPAKKAYARFDREEFKNIGQRAVETTKKNKEQEREAGMSTTIEDYKLTKELDEAGPEMVGLPTRHYRFSLSYKSVMRMPGMPMAMTTKVSETREFWATTALANEGLGGEDGSERALTGLELIDLDIEAERTMAALGFKLKSITTSNTSGGGMPGMPSMFGGGRPSKSVTTREIVSFERLDPPADAFVLPKDYEETDMLNLFAGRKRMPNLDGKQPVTKPNSGTKKMPDLNSVK